MKHIRKITIERKTTYFSNPRQAYLLPWETILKLTHCKCFVFQTIIIMTFKNINTHQRLTQNAAGWYKSDVWLWAVCYMEYLHPLTMNYFILSRVLGFFHLRKYFMTLLHVIYFLCIHIIYSKYL